MRATGAAPLSHHLPVELLTLLVNVGFAHPARISDKAGTIKTGYGEDLRTAWLRSAFYGSAAPGGCERGGSGHAVSAPTQVFRLHSRSSIPN